MTGFHKDHNQVRGLHELPRIEDAASEVQLRDATGDGVIDMAAVKGL
jgi:hypothetical protein